MSGRVARRLVGVDHQRTGYYIASCVSLGSMVIPTLWSVEAASGPFKSTVDVELSQHGTVYTASTSPSDPLDPSVGVRDGSSATTLNPAPRANDENGVTGSLSRTDSAAVLHSDLPQAIPHRPPSISHSPVDLIHLSLRDSTVQPQRKFPPMPRAMERDPRAHAAAPIIASSIVQPMLVHKPARAFQRVGYASPSLTPLGSPGPRLRARVSSTCCAVGCDADHHPR